MAYLRQQKDKWYCCWREPSGKQRSKSCGPGLNGKKLAQQLKEKIEAELILGTYGEKGQIRWMDFLGEYNDHVTERHSEATATSTWYTLAHFNRLINVQYVHQINARYVDEYIRLRKQEGISNRTVNKELSTLRAMLGVAKRWGYLAEVPDIRPLRVPKRLETFISEEEFSAIYAVCNVATRPLFNHVTPEEWWRGFLLFQFMTGWRVGQVLKVRWDQLYEDVIVSSAEDNKGKRDVSQQLHPVVIEHLQPLRKTYRAEIFARRRMSDGSLKSNFKRIQQAAGITPRHKPPGKWYTFHDLRRGFATVNAGRLDTFELQALMQHQSLTTTQKYVAMGHRLSAAVDKLVVPELGGER